MISGLIIIIDAKRDAKFFFCSARDARVKLEIAFNGRGVKNAIGISVITVDLMRFVRDSRVNENSQDVRDPECR